MARVVRVKVLLITLLTTLVIVLLGACGSSPERVSTGDASFDPTPVATVAPTEVPPPPSTPELPPEPEPTEVPATEVPATEVPATEVPVATTTVAPVPEPAPTIAPTPTVVPATAVPQPTAAPVLAAVRVPDALPDVLAPFALPPGGVPLCVTGIVGPDTLNVRAGPGVEYEIRGALRPDACILRVAGPATVGWQPVHVVVASDELVVIEGWVSSRFITSAADADTAEAAVVASDPASILSVPPVGDPLLADPCEGPAPDGSRMCGLTGWFWQEAPHPCAQHRFSHWKRSTVYGAEARPRADGSWVVQSLPTLVLDC